MQSCLLEPRKKNPARGVTDAIPAACDPWKMAGKSLAMAPAGQALVALETEKWQITNASLMVNGLNRFRNALGLSHPQPQLPVGIHVVR